VPGVSELVHLDVETGTAGTATITLDSPANRNALSAQLRRELTGHLRTALDDDAVRVVVLTHTGPVFCSGMDLRESRGAGADDQGVNEYPAILEMLWTSRKPVVARLAGPARAGGVGLVAACDIAVVQGGLSTTMELTASGRPFLYFPLGHHFEQQVHVRHRLERHGAGRAMDYRDADPARIAQALVEEVGRPVSYLPVPTDGAARAAQLVADLL
jgi:enoyl-CoA hydratase/carnithine racemase